MGVQGLAKGGGFYNQRLIPSQDMDLAWDSIGFLVAGRSVVQGRVNSNRRL